VQQQQVIAVARRRVLVTKAVVMVLHIGLVIAVAIVVAIVLRRSTAMTTAGVVIR
jgi:hypothetical protein